MNTPDADDHERMEIATRDAEILAAHADHGSRARRGAVATVLSRVLYWSPVAAATVMFAQVALVGLRPALCERERLDAAERALRERHEGDVALCADISAQLDARSDPIFLERQRRWRHSAVAAQR